MGGSERRVGYDRNVLGGEGGDEVEFFRYLRSLYSGDLTNPKLRDGRGGNPKNATQVALRNLTQLGAYRRRMMVFDGDRAEDVVRSGIEECEKEPGIEYVISDNRFEVEIGRIMGCNDRIMKRLQSDDRHTVKQAFYEICPPGIGRYEKLFSKDMLDERRRESVWLDRIISFIEGLERDES